MSSNVDPGYIASEDDKLVLSVANFVTASLQGIELKDTEKFIVNSHVIVFQNPYSMLSTLDLSSSSLIAEIVDSNVLSSNSFFTDCLTRSYGLVNSSMLFSESSNFLKLQ